MCRQWENLCRAMTPAPTRIWGHPHWSSTGELAVTAFDGIRRGIILVDPRDGTLTALPRPGQMPLAAIAELASLSGWSLRELHLESGRLDEVFRAVTRPEAGHG